MKSSEPQLNQRWTLLMVYLNAFQLPLMLSAVNVGLPQFATSLQMDAVLLSWVATAFLMASVMFVLMFGRIADMLGRKKVFVWGTVTLILASLLAAMSSTGLQLVSMRFLQGVGAAMIYATQIAILSSVCSPTQRGRAIGKMVSILYLGLSCGPFLGGYVLEFLGWRSLLLIQVPLALIVLLIALFRVSGEWKADETAHMDVPGAVSYALSIAALCLGASLQPGLNAYACLLLGCAGLVVFVVIERRARHPMFDVSLFVTNRVFTLSCLASYMMYAATFANVVLISLYLQFLKGLPASEAGLIMMTQPLCMALCAPFSGRLSDRIEPRVIASAGIGMTIAGLILLGLFDENTSLLWIVISLGITGLGFGLFSIPNVNAIMGSVEKRQYGLASASNATMRLLGQMSSMLIVTFLMSFYLGKSEISPAVYPQLQQVISTAFLLAACLCIPGIFFSLVRGQLHR